MPTELGKIVNKLLCENFADVINVEFTAKVENEFDNIAEGKENWKKMIEEFYGTFEENVERVEKELEHVKLEDEVSDVQCEKCGTIYEVTGKEATRPAMVKYKKSSRTHISNGAFVNTQNYSHYAKKFHCPCCDKKTYGKVLDIQELQYEGQDSTIKELGKGFLRMVIGCTIILILAQIPFQIGKKQREREVQQMKEQQYEDLKNKANNRK